VARSIFRSCLHLVLVLLKLSFGILISRRYLSRTGDLICCDGRKVSCVWESGGNINTKNKKGREIIDLCITEHEKEHKGQIPDCDPKPDLYRPKVPRGKRTDTNAMRIHVRRNAWRPTRRTVQEMRNASQRLNLRLNMRNRA
jgi:hypothetical protein